MTPRWTLSDIPRQDGRTVIVTGANSGIGLVAARELARAGATVTLACRNLEKGQQALASINRDAPGARTQLAELDLGSLASVRRFAEQFSGERSSLDLLINNAGLMAPPRRLTEDGFELQFGTNHLGHFALTGHLLPLMLKQPNARVVNVSSGAHKMGRINFDDPQGEHSYGRWSAYGQSKLANLLFAFELDRRLQAAGTPARALAAHPGYAATNLQFAAVPRYEAWFMSVGNQVFAQSAEMGALPTLFAATNPALKGGTYAGPDGMFEMRGHPTVVQPSQAASSSDDARKLWELSENLTGVTYDFSAGRMPTEESITAATVTQS